MSSTMMDVPLTLDWIADRAERAMGNVEVVSRRADKSIARTTYGAVIRRARQLARPAIVVHGAIDCRCPGVHVVGFEQETTAVHDFR